MPLAKQGESSGGMNDLLSQALLCLCSRKQASVSARPGLGTAPGGKAAAGPGPDTTDMSRRGGLSLLDVPANLGAAGRRGPRPRGSSGFSITL